MANYVILRQDGQRQLLRVTGTTASPVRDLPEEVSDSAAHDLAARLREAVSYIPGTCVDYVLDRIGAEHLADPNGGWHSHEGGFTDWEDLPASTAVFPLSEHAVNVLDGTPLAGTELLWHLERLGRALARFPERVRRTVREEVRAAFAAYDTTPVVARVYDAKYGECDQLVLLNGALALLDEQGLARVTAGDGTEALRVLAERELADLTFAMPTWEQGYLAVAVNAAQLAAWKAAHSD